MEVSIPPENKDEDSGDVPRSEQNGDVSPDTYKDNQSEDLSLDTRGKMSSGAVTPDTKGEQNGDDVVILSKTNGSHSGNINEQYNSKEVLTATERESSGDVPKESKDEPSADFSTVNKELRRGDVSTESKVGPSKGEPNRDIPKEIKKELNGDVSLDSNGEPNGNIPKEIKEEPSGDVTKESKEEPSGDVPTEIKEEPSGDVPTEIKEEPSGDVFTEIKEEPSGDVTKESKEEPSGDVPTEIKEEPSGDVTKESKEEHIGDVTTETKGDDENGGDYGVLRQSEIVSAAEGKVTKSSKSSSRSSSRLSSKDGERSPKMGHIVWKRPKELNPRSRLLSGGKMFRGDLVEGVRGTPNFGAACSALALKHELLFQVMPDDQCPIAFEDDWGIYKFRFWRYGNWTEVTIDDKLPSVAGELLYSHTLENDEHWMCVMEKAYAKFNGCYDIINKIPLSDMLQHMTGGITETLTLRTVGSSEQLGCYVENCFKKRALILTTALKSKEGMMLGLDSELPYIVTRVKRRTRVHPCLVCLYSPFGASGWAGPWGRDSPEWRNFSHDDVYNFGLMNESDFDFWISVEDLVEFFETVFIAHQSSDTMAGIVQQLDPSIVSLVRSGVFGNWIKDKTDGGAPNNAKFLTHNIQFLVTQQSIDDKMCVLSLVQRFRPRNTPHEGFMCIGFSVFKAPENIQYRMTDLKEAPVAIATYSYKESVSVRVDLEPGNYVVIPTSYQAGVVGEYLLRCVSPRNLNIRALKQAPPSVTKKQVIDVELLCGENLPDVTHSYDADPEQEVYCVIWCGKEKCQFPIKRGPNPLWNSIATFHAKSPYKRTIFVQVWYKPAPGSSAKEDVCLAETCQLPIITGDHKVVCQLTLSKKTSANKTPNAIPKSSKKGGSRCAGSITLIVRYNPLPTVFRGIPKGGSNVQVVSMDRGRERVMDTSESENSSNRDRKCRTEPRGGVALLNHVALSNQGSISSLVRSGTNSPHRPSVGSNYNADQIILPPTAALNREQLNRASPARRSRSRHPTDEDAIIQANRSKSMHSRPQNGGPVPVPGGSNSLDDLFDDDRPVKLMVNCDKTLSPEQPLRGLASDHSLRAGTILPPYQYPTPIPEPNCSNVNFIGNGDHVDGKTNGSILRTVAPTPR